MGFNAVSQMCMAMLSKVCLLEIKMPLRTLGLVPNHIRPDFLVEEVGGPECLGVLLRMSPGSIPTSLRMALIVV